MKYRKRTIVVEAIQWTGDNYNEIRDFCPLLRNSISHRSAFIIETLEGAMEVSLNDYIVKGVNDEFYPCKPDIFEQTYEVVE